MNRFPIPRLIAAPLLGLCVAALFAIGPLAAAQGQAPQHGTTAKLTTAIFAGGCFWCMEAAFDEVKGVTDTTSGYAGGTKPHPTYDDHQGYQEAVRVTYDPSKVSYAKLLNHYWHNIDPFDPAGQFCDKGNSYRAVIFTDNAAEKALAEKTKAAIAARFHKTVTTEIRPRTTFTPAEAYHQNYHITHPYTYAFYKWNCGRAQRLHEIWGAPS